MVPRLRRNSIRHIERATKLGASAVTGIFRSAASEVATAEAGIETVQERLHELTRKHWIKMHTKPQSHYGWRLIKRLFKAKTHRSPLEATAQLFQHIKLDSLEKTAAFVKPPWQDPPSVIVEEEAPATLRATQLGLRTIFTDGSCRNGLTGIGIYAPSIPGLERSGTIGFAPSTDALQAELIAISEAISEATAKIPAIGWNLDQCHVLSDCQKALRMIERPQWKKSNPLKEIFQKLAEAEERGFTFIFRWVPAHKGVHGNERAHALAQSATAPGSEPEDHAMVLRHAIKQGRSHPETRRKAFLAKQTGRFAKELDKALPSRHTRKLYDRLSRDQAALLVQVRSGYCRLNSYLHKIAKAESSDCECGTTESVHHFILECTKWEEQRQQLKTVVGTRARDLAFLLGAYESESKDGPIKHWSPNMEAVSATLRFIQDTGRLDLQA